MILLDGKVIANKIKDELKETIQKTKDSNKFVELMFGCDLSYTTVPELAVIQIGNNQASSTYVKNKQKACEYVGIRSMVYNLDENVNDDYVINLIESLNNNNNVDGILVQLPLPSHLNEEKILIHIDPSKDVDGFHESNVGRFNLGNKNAFVPCTPLGIEQILKNYNIDVAGKECVVVGRSNIVGKPMANMLLKMDGTVTVAHSKTENLKEVCKRADILICAIGKPKFFNKDYIKDGAVVIDVGINRDENGKLCGDVDFDDVKDIVSAITPVPGGCGPMTVAMLMYNVFAAKQRNMAVKYKNLREGMA